MQIETRRLVLRTLQCDDIVPLATLWSDASVTRYLGGPRDFENVQKNLEEDLAQAQPPQFDLWTLVEKSSGRVIGHCGLLDKEVDGRAEIELIYVLAIDAWGKGYATEIAAALRDYAFHYLGLSRLIALVEPKNVSSARVAEKVGMRDEKQIVRPGGHVRHVYAITRPEK
jgi:[ribosomal protein S5]-alanine N-acetyltransferase